jgi:hypothetical protein
MMAYYVGHRHSGASRFPPGSSKEKDRFRWTGGNFAFPTEKKAALGRPNTSHACYRTLNESAFVGCHLDVAHDERTGALVGRRGRRLVLLRGLATAAPSSCPQLLQYLSGVSTILIPFPPHSNLELE